jgi:hypothetical protein
VERDEEEELTSITGFRLRGSESTYKLPMWSSRLMQKEETSSFLRGAAADERWAAL